MAYYSDLVNQRTFVNIINRGKGLISKFKFNWALFSSLQDNFSLMFSSILCKEVRTFPIRLLYYRNTKLTQLCKVKFTLSFTKFGLDQWFSMGVLLSLRALMGVCEGDFSGCDIAR